MNQAATEEALRQLVQSSKDLLRTAEAADLRSAELVLAKRETELAALECSLTTCPLNARQLALLGEAVRQGQAAMRLLVACRETRRAQLSEIEAERRRLAGWMPRRTASPSHLDSSA